MDISEQEQITASLSQKLHIRFSKLWQQLSLEQRWYVLAAAFPAAILIYNQAPDFLPKHPQSQDAAFIAFLVFSAVGIFYYLSKLAQKINNNILLKACFSALFIAGATFALSYSDGLINETLKVSSAPFSYTQTIAALLLIPIFIGFTAIALSILSIFLITFSSSISSLKLYERNDENRFPTQTMIVRCALLIYFGVLSEKALTQSDGYQKIISEVIQDYAYNFEMDRYTHCDSSEGERFAYIDSNTVIVGTEQNGKYKFSVRACEESIPQGIGRTLDETAKELVRRIAKGTQ